MLSAGNSALCGQQASRAFPAVLHPSTVSRRKLRPLCSQAGSNPQQGGNLRSGMQPMQPVQPIMPAAAAAPGTPQQQQPMMNAPAAEPKSAALARRQQPQQMVYIEMSQVMGKQVITRTTGRNLGVISAMWVDPVRYEVVSLDLDDKKGVGSMRIANFPLARLTQIGDVVLVHDETVMYEQPLDGRYGYYVLAGMEVRTRNGDFLGKVRCMCPRLALLQPGPSALCHVPLAGQAQGWAACCSGALTTA